VPTEEYLADLRESIAGFHHFTIREHGGVPTFRDEGLFDLAVARPWMTAFGEEIYKTPFQKAAAIAEAIARGHPFNDGNHRTALAAAHKVLARFDLIIVAMGPELREAILALGGGVVSIDDFARLLERKSALRSRPN
jgi:death on curing protein